MKLGISKFLLLLLLFQLAKSKVPAHGILDSPSDINHQDLVGWVSEKLNTAHLGLFTGQISDRYKGRLCGQYQRPMISLPVKLPAQNCSAIDVIFKLETGSGQSTVSQKTLQKLREVCPGVRERYHDARDLVIAGRISMLGDSSDFYEELNILGTDFFDSNNALIFFDYSVDRMGNVQMEFTEYQDQEFIFMAQQEEIHYESRGQEVQMIQSSI